MRLGVTIPRSNVGSGHKLSNSSGVFRVLQRYRHLSDSSECGAISTVDIPVVDVRQVVQCVVIM